MPLIERPRPRVGLKGIEPQLGLLLLGEPHQGAADPKAVKVRIDIQMVDPARQQGDMASQDLAVERALDRPVDHHLVAVEDDILISGMKRGVIARDQRAPTTMQVCGGGTFIRAETAQGDHAARLVQR